MQEFLRGTRVRNVNWIYHVYCNLEYTRLQGGLYTVDSLFMEQTLLSMLCPQYKGKCHDTDET